MKPRKLLNVLPECYVDTNLIEYLLDAGVNHQHSCSKVVGQLNTTFANSFAVGIIDKDKVEMGYVKECEIIPADLKGFTQESKAVTSNTDPRFKHLFAALKGNGEISALRTTLHYLCENQYNADIEVLKGLFSIRQAQI